MTMFISCEKDTSVEVDTPQVENITFEECIDIALYLPPTKFSIDFTNKGVNITHYLLEVNCAFDTVLITTNFENGILNIIEEGDPIINGSCVCQTNVSYTISKILKQNVDQIVINGEIAWSANQQKENLLIGKWKTSDYNSGHNDTMHFTADKRIEDYFLFTRTTMY
ncbi:MAG: hypothetical protein GX879_02860, partial [Bacteroidales bacterium]|nr:hypothetical protein [Bacteroidales bacterium]